MSQQSMQIDNDFKRLMKRIDQALEGEYLRGFNVGRLHDSESEYLAERFGNWT